MGGGGGHDQEQVLNQLKTDILDIIHMKFVGKRNEIAQIEKEGYAITWACQRFEILLLNISTFD